MWHWIAHHLGTDNLSGGYYGFWSGFGSDLQEFAIIGTVLALLFRHNCHEHGCWRLSRHTVVDPTSGEHVVRCRKHHREWKADAGA